MVDSISHEGEHRVTAIWRYDKRPLNGAAFVYYGLRLWEGEDGRKMDWALARYAHACLDALGIRNGFSHAEVMWLEGEAGGPCLVEVGARPHGGEGTFVSLTAEAIGYNQLSVALDLIRDPQALAGIPLLPPPLKAHAAEVCLVSRKSGRLLRHFLTEHVAGNTLPSLKVSATVWWEWRRGGLTVLGGGWGGWGEKEGFGRGRRFRDAGVPVVPSFPLSFVEWDSEMSGGWAGREVKGGWVRENTSPRG